MGKGVRFAAGMADENRMPFLFKLRMEVELKMKKIECIIRTEKLKELEGVLRQIGVGGMTITEVKGFGKETTRPDAYLILPKTKVEIYATDQQIEELTKVIIDTCCTGELGDGKIIILPVEEVIRIRTGEKQDEAIF